MYFFDTLCNMIKKKSTKTNNSIHTTERYIIYLSCQNHIIWNVRYHFNIPMSDDDVRIKSISQTSQVIIRTV